MYVIFDTQLKSRSIIYRLVCPYLIRTDKKEIFTCGYKDTLQPIIMKSKKGSLENVVIVIAFFFFYDEKSIK
jgi:hypothetical protein